MNRYIIFLVFLALLIENTLSDDVLGCGGFLKSHVPIDFSEVEVKLVTKQGILKDKTSCAPNNGYYFLPIYDKGEYVIELNPPPGWSFSPTKVDLSIDRISDPCSKGVDINFNFKGFGITGRVENFGDPSNGPEGVTVELKSGSEKRKTITSKGGTFSFTPVYPGTYNVQIQHPKWKLLKSELQVKVTEGNTELPKNSLVVHGYRVTGFVKSEGEAISDTSVLIFSENLSSRGNEVLECDKNLKAESNFPKHALCQVKTDPSGRFTFISVAVGAYHISPFYLNQNIDVEPKQIQFTVSEKDIELENTFEVIGFSVSGKVCVSADSAKLEGIPNVKIFLNGKLTAETDKDGNYRLEKLKTGVYKIKGEAENMIFEEVSIKINPNVQSLPVIVPSAFKICGKVESDQSQLVTFVKIGSTLMKNVLSDIKTRKFCEYLPRGTYEVQVQINSNKGNALHFHPISQKVEVTGPNDNIISFSQLKATIVGKVKCYREEDCKNLEVLLSLYQMTEEKIYRTLLKGQSYQFTDIPPGTYKLSLFPDKLCWVKSTHEIVVNSVTLNAPIFVQSGYSVKFISSHNTKVSYKLMGDSIKEELEIKKGESSHCLPKYGIYIFEYLGCHTYDNLSFTYNTQSENNQLKLNAATHLNSICIASDANYGPVTVSIDIDGEKIQKGPLTYQNGCYILEIQLDPEASAIILPQSEMYYFNPPIYSVKGKNDCTQWGQLFQAIKGHVFKGKIVPALAGTLITLEDDSGKISTTETDRGGFYKFPPLDLSRNYKISAKKESYQLVGPSENGDFLAYKLAQIVVEVLDESDKSPLQGTLLSLSGGPSYRSNLQTDENGKITFHSLNPSEYYLRPMMKEYSFEPVSKIIPVKEGELINITLIGKRVACSAFGSVTSLNNIPEHNLAVEAIGIGNCSHLSEETKTEANGKFRVRGLQPYCTYKLRTSDPSIEQCIPENIEIEVTGNDIKDLHFIAVRPKKQTKVLVNIQSNVPGYSRLLKLSVYLKGPPSVLVYSIKLDANAKIIKEPNVGIMVYLPPLPKDGKTYLLQLETTSSQNLKWVTQGTSLITNSTFKFVKLEYSVMTNVTEQQIKQTSIWSLIFIVSTLLIAYNIDIVFRFMNDKFNLKLNSLSAIMKNKMHQASDYPVNNADIDQIVQSINAVKRKSKRNS